MVQIAGNRGNGTRSGVDFYPTHHAWTRVLLDEVHLPKRVWEPACGDGAMVRVLEEAHKVQATDITQGIDFLLQRTRYPAIVTNPPFSLFDEFALHAYSLASQVSAMLMGVHMLGGGKRRERLWSRIPPSKVIVIAERMPVLNIPGSHNSQFNHVWVVWDKRTDGPTELVWRSTRSGL